MIRFTLFGVQVSIHPTLWLTLAILGRAFCVSSMVELLSVLLFIVAAFVVLLALSLFDGANKKRLALAGVFFLGAMCANFILMFALFYPERVAISTTVLLICANAILVQELFRQGTYKTVVVSILMVLILTAPVHVLRGVKDIYETYVFTRNNEAYLYQCAQDGQMDVVLPMMIPGTKYSPMYDLRYLKTDDPTDWPNNVISRYYGVDSVTGIEPEYILP